MNLKQYHNNTVSNKLSMDLWLCSCIIILCLAGIPVVLSVFTSFLFIYSETAWSLSIDHIIRVLLGLFLFGVFIKLKYHYVVKFAYVLWTFAMVLLLITIVSGIEIYGSNRTFSYGKISFQPVSLVGLSLIVLLSYRFNSVEKKHHDWISILISVVTCLLIGINDLSSAVVLFIVSFIMLFCSGIKWEKIGIVSIIGLLFLVSFIIIEPERMRRVTDYSERIFNIPDSQLIQGEGYQAQQSYIAINRGGLFGVGLGKSIQRDYIPAAYNDFVYAIVLEEYGLVGGIILLAIYGIILYRGLFFIALKSSNKVAQILATGCTLMIVLPSFLSAAVAAGVAPVTGLSMTYISYGGMNMIASCIMGGILLNISKHNVALGFNDRHISVSKMVKV